jgi:hypothetical protein
MKLIPNWKKAYKMISVQAMTLALAIQGAWQTLPPAMLASINPTLVTTITLVLLGLGILGRVVTQPSVEVNEDKS